MPNQRFVSENLDDEVLTFFSELLSVVLFKPAVVLSTALFHHDHLVLFLSLLIELKSRNLIYDIPDIDFGVE